MIECWCGNSELSSFGPNYMRCSVCETLVSRLTSPMEQPIVDDDETDFYGKQYWLSHQQQDLGHPDIYDRARNDLKERNLHWLRALLKYSLPPAKVLELGCSHGSFVALMTQAGYEAAGVEMSPWVVEFGQKTFEVPIHVGPVENLDISPQSLDVIALMDVLEHLPDPVATMSKCMELLKPDGFLLIQTPEFKESMHYKSLVEEDSPFLIQLKADEHLYLFSKQSVTKFLKQIGGEYIYFEPAIFSHYDMFYVASKAALTTHDLDESVLALQKTPNGRIALALLDMRESEFAQAEKFQVLEEDRAARLEKIHILTRYLEEEKSVNSQLQESNSQLKESILNKEKNKPY